MSLENTFDLFFNATLRDWKAQTRWSQSIKEIFEAGNAVQIVADDTDLTFSTRGRKHKIGDGHINMPDGEVLTTPVDDSVEGYIRFDFPRVFFGQKVEGISLEQSGVRVVKATAERNEALLRICDRTVSSIWMDRKCLKQADTYYSSPLIAHSGRVTCTEPGEKEV